jgi:purine-binding chemotaxis protein CheW
MRELVHAPSLLVVFVLDGQKYALRLPVVEKVIRALYVTSLPNVPDVVLGVIDVQGWIIPVIDLRQRLGLPRRGLELSDQFIIARTSYRTVALVVDDVAGVLEVSDQTIVSSREILRNFDSIEGAVRLSSELILIYDLSQFLSIEEERALENALES